MNIQLLSDLHLEQNTHFEPTPAPDADLLILAGDIGSYQRGSKMPADDHDFGLDRFSPLAQYAGWPVPVYYLPGNHEYDALDFDATHQRLRATCDRLGIDWLERETRVLGDVRLVGTTLWTDFDALLSTIPESSKQEREEMRARSRQAADHYLGYAATTRAGQILYSEQLREQGLLCQDWLRAELQEPFDGVTVAVTHFAPSLRSADPRYGLTPGTAGFCNALDELFEHADWWLHGHVHCPVDYQAGRCHVLANPLGYLDKGEGSDFQPTLTIPVGRPSTG